MNLKSLLQPTIDKICAEVREEALAEIRGEGRKQGGWPREWVEAWIKGWEEGRIEGWEEGRKEERAKNNKVMKSWLEEQIRAGKIHKDVELPVFGGNGNHQ